MKSIKYAFMILFFALIAVDLKAESTAEIGADAPQFELKDSYGKTHKLSDFKGKTVVLEWVNFDCPFVIKHYKSENMQKLQKEYTKKGIIWLSICSSAPEKQGNFDNKTINNRIKESKASMTAYLIDADGKVGRKYGAKTTPHLFIVSAEGKLLYAGGIDDIKSTDTEDVAKAHNYVRQALDEILGSKKVSQPTSVPYGCSVKY